MDRPGRRNHRFLILHDDVARRLALAHEMHDAVGIDIVEFEIEIDLAAPLVDVRGHRVPDAAFLEHGQPHDELRAVAHAGNDELEDRSEEHTSELQSLMRISYA